MKKKRILAAVLGFCLAVLSGCGTSSQPREEMPLRQEEQYTFTDALGREVTVESPQKVAAGIGSFGEVWLLAGGQLAAVTQDAYYERNLQLPETVADLGSMQQPNVEMLAAEGIDFVILSSKVSEHVALQDTLEALEIPCAYFEVETFSDYLQMLEICCDITGQPELYQQNGLAVQARIDDAIARKEGKLSPKVLLLRAYSTGAKAKGSDNLAGAILKDLGCVNIADSDVSLLEDLSMEKIIQEDPDYIFVTTMGVSSEAALQSLAEGIQSNPAWGELTAVKEGRYILLEKELFHYKPNARWGESYEKLAGILYGEE